MKRTLVSVVLLAAVLVLTVAAHAGKPPILTVPDAVIGGTTTATVTSQHVGSVIQVSCYSLPWYERVLYAATLPVVDNQAVFGPFDWEGQDAHCSATYGWVNGNGTFRVIARDAFYVTGG